VPKLVQNDVFPSILDQNSCLKHRTFFALPIYRMFKPRKTSVYIESDIYAKFNTNRNNTILYIYVTSFGKTRLTKGQMRGVCSGLQKTFFLLSARIKNNICISIHREYWYRNERTFCANI